MKNIWSWVKNNPNRTMFLAPILLVAGISISHVVSWYSIANPINWAIYLSIAIEIGAITALIATTNKIKGGIWFMFGIVTFIQMMGNIFYSYKEINESGELFKSWVELTGPIWELMGTEQTDVIGLKRWLAFLQGGLLPIISLTSLHFFVKYEKPEEKEKTPSSEESDKIWGKVKELRKEGKLSEPIEEDIKNEPTSLSNSQYRNEEEFLIDVEQPTTLNEEGESITEKKDSPQPTKPMIEEISGVKLSKTWSNMINKKKLNNGITRLGE